MSTRTRPIQRHINEGDFFDRMALFLDYLMPDISNEKSQAKTKAMIDSFRDLHAKFELSLRPKLKS